MSQFSVDGNMSNISSLRTTAMAIKLNQFHATPGLAERPPGEGNTTARTKAAREEVKLKKKKNVYLLILVCSLFFPKISSKSRCAAMEHAIAY